MKKTIFLLFCIAFILGITKNSNTQVLWGSATKGGTGNIGTLFYFRSLPNPNFTTGYNFPTPYPGEYPYHTHLVECNQMATAGNLYGMTLLGGAYNLGVIFQYNFITNSYTKILDFNGTNGAQPNSSLFYNDTDGALYGVTGNGGLYGKGVFFKLNPITFQYTIIHNFNVNDSKGIYPTGSLIKAGDGKLYGLTTGGGTNYNGVIFSYSIGENTIKKEFDFYGSFSPYGSLTTVSYASNKLYGLSCIGGANNLGAVYEYTIGTGITYTLSFDDNNGQRPFGSLIEDPINHKLYGMTSLGGGTSGQGTIFECDFSNTAMTPPTITTKVIFNGTNGQRPYGSLIKVNNKFYGLTSDEALICGPRGTIFEFFVDRNGNGVLNTLHHFTDAAAPMGSLMQASNGLLYGMTSQGIGGNATNGGILFKYNIKTSNYQTILRFEEGIEGSNPRTLVQASNGDLYGITKNGGTLDYGTLYQYDFNTNLCVKKIDFPHENCYPIDIIIDKRNVNNNLIYGISSFGLFEYNLNGTLTARGAISFNPIGITQATLSDNKIYGMTQGGGNGYGTIFVYDPNNPSLGCVTIFNFPNYMGNHPVGRLVETSPGVFYGIAYNSTTPPNGPGVIFEYIPANGVNGYTKKFDFSDNNGMYPQGGLVKATNGKLYGMTLSGGGTNSFGVLFEYQMNGTYTKLVNFTSATGCTPRNTSLIQASDGKLYGATTAGGAYYNGKIFSYDIASQTFVAFQDIISPIICDHFTEVFRNKGGSYTKLDDNSIINENQPIIISVYPNPASNYVMINNIEKATVKIYDIMGNEVMNIENITNNRKIDLSAFSNGTYLLKIIQNNKTITEKFTIVK